MIFQKMSLKNERTFVDVKCTIKQLNGKEWRTEV